MTAIDCDRCLPGQHGDRIDVHKFGETPCVHTLAQWAYRTIGGSHITRVEVGQDLLDALTATAAPDPDPDYQGPRTPHTTLLGVPIAVNDELAPMAWRTLDWFDDVISEGSGWPT